MTLQVTAIALLLVVGTPAVVLGAGLRPSTGAHRLAAAGDRTYTADRPDRPPLKHDGSQPPAPCGDCAAPASAGTGVIVHRAGCRQLVASVVVLA